MTKEKRVKPAKNEKTRPKFQKRLIRFLWTILLAPFVGIVLMLFLAWMDGLPNVEDLENPQISLASEVYSSDNFLLGKYFRENRTNVNYNELSPYLVDCLVATEDERFYEHTGVDFEALMRVVKGVITRSTSQGGGSTLSQQLAKMLFERGDLGTWGLTKRKFQEWIIATQIERRYTKEEIITMYLNKFDFINNAVGIKSAARIYFNTSPDSLTLEQAATLVGMAKNPSLYNPVKYPTNAIKRREVVLKQLLKNNDNSHIKTKITLSDYDRLRKMPLGINYTKVDHAEGLAPYFREELRKELVKIFHEKDENGNYKIHKKDGLPYDVYEDGLKVYTTLDSRMQKYAEWAVVEHMKTELQDVFQKLNKKTKNYPFADNVKIEKIEQILEIIIKQTNRYKIYTGKICGYCERSKDFISIRKENGKTVYYCNYCKHRTVSKSEPEIDKMFATKYPMKVFSWKKKDMEFDTTMTPNDSIKYYLNFLQAALISIDPHTGFIKAWVGGTNFKHFKYDHVTARRQVGSTFKPFVYAAAFRDGIFTPCSEIPDVEHCIEVPFAAKTTKPWCPSNSGEAYSGQPMPLYFALPASMNNITAAIIKEEKPATVIRMLESMGIPKNYLPPVPSICLGACELSALEITGAQASFANKGIYIKPIMFTRIEDKNGNVIFDVEPQTSEAMDENTAFTMLEIMKGVTSGVVHPSAKNKSGRPLMAGTGCRIRSNPKYGQIKSPIAGKTGTTQDNTDGWFIGLTPDLVTGVWVGGENSGIHFPSYRTDMGQGANTSLPIWGYFMKKVYADKKLKISTGDFEKPEGYHSFDCSELMRNNSDLWKEIDLKDVETDMFEIDKGEEHIDEGDDEKIFGNSGD